METMDLLRVNKNVAKDTGKKPANTWTKFGQTNKTGLSWFRNSKDFNCCEALAKQQHYSWLTVWGLGAL